jgi:DEAD/DEAH box helicase domain-containing protein
MVLNLIAASRALCPDLVKFAYIPKNDLLVHGSNQPALKRGISRDKGPDYSEFGSSQLRDSQDHVLILEFKESVRGQKTNNP